MLQMVSLDKIWWNKRYRDDLGDIDALAESIKEKGVLQPVTVTPELELQAGERRVTAARKAGLAEIPALIRAKSDEIDSREVELLENIMRKDFDWPERVALVAEIDRLCREKNVSWNMRKTAELMDKGVASVSRDIQLAAAVRAMPELSEVKTADEALKVIKKAEDNLIVAELRRRQEKQIQSNDASMDKGVKLALRVAAHQYNIGDAFVGLSELKTQTVSGWTHWNIIECDPPYGIDLQDVKMSKDSVTSNVHSYNEVNKDVYPTFLRRLAKELFRVAGQHTWLIFWYGPTWHTEVLTALREAGWEVDDIPAIWAKGIGQTMRPEQYLARTYEPFFIASKGKPAVIKRGRSNVFTYAPVPGTQKYHPTERPVALMEEILNTFGLPRGTVLVPFLGSGATLRAAYNCGMVGLGWDTNKEYKDKFLLAVEGDARGEKVEQSDEELSDETEASSE